MPYCAPDDVKGEIYLPLLQQMTARFKGELDAYLSGHIRRADDYIDAILTQAFDTPFDPVPRIVATISAKLVAYYATARFSEREEIAADKLASAAEMLEALVASGRLPGDPSDPAEATERMRAGSDPQVFTTDLMRDW